MALDEKSLTAEGSIFHTWVSLVSYPADWNPEFFGINQYSICYLLLIPTALKH